MWKRYAELIRIFIKPLTNSHHGSENGPLEDPPLRKHSSNIERSLDIIFGVICVLSAILGTFKLPDFFLI